MREVFLCADRRVHADMDGVRVLFCACAENSLPDLPLEREIMTDDEEETQVSGVEAQRLY